MLRVLASDLDPETIKPKRVYRRTRYFARNELSRLCLNALRVAANEPLSVDDLVTQAMMTKGFDLADTPLRASIRDQVAAVLKRLHASGNAERISTGSSSKWKRAGDA